MDLKGVDRLFCRMMGEGWAWEQHMGSGAPGSAPLPAIWQKMPNGLGTPTLIAQAPSSNIRQSHWPQEDKTLMERAFNDWRRSFFGASPTYARDGSVFQALDCDGQGGATMSTPATVDGATNSVCLAGAFVIQKSHFWRILVRGELVDVLTRSVAASANLETAYTVDPDGDWFDGPFARSRLVGGGSLADSRILYRRWLHNLYNADRDQTYQE
jgi:hypothetical protein